MEIGVGWGVGVGVGVGVATGTGSQKKLHGRLHPGSEPRQTPKATIATTGANLTNIAFMVAPWSRDFNRYFLANEISVSTKPTPLKSAMMIT